MLKVCLLLGWAIQLPFHRYTIDTLLKLVNEERFFFHILNLVFAGTEKISLMLLITFMLCILSDMVWNVTTNLSVYSY